LGLFVKAWHAFICHHIYFERRAAASATAQGKRKKSQKCVPAELSHARVVAHLIQFALAKAPAEDPSVAICHSKDHGSLSSIAFSCAERQGSGTITGGSQNSNEGVSEV
jgi:hypothetical protein